jgi:hypothetical protein
MTDHTTLNTTAALLARTIDSYGIDHYALAEKAGINARHIYHPDERISFTNLKKGWLPCQPVTAT